MIKKIGTIKHFAVFENYDWDLSSTDKNGRPLKFEKINILYGRNYSGKTTLSSFFKKIANSTAHLWRAFPEDKILVIGPRKLAINLIETKYDKEPVFISCSSEYQWLNSKK